MEMNATTVRIKTFSHKLITREEEKSIWQTYRAADKHQRDKAHKRLVESYLPLVSRVVEGVAVRLKKKIQKEELIGAGVIGLHAAINNFSFQRGISFSAFAHKRIQGAILDDLRSRDPLTRCQRQNYKQICNAVNRLYERFSRTPSLEEIVEEVGLSSCAIEMYLGMGMVPIKLDDPCQDGVAYKDLIPDTSIDNPCEIANRSLAREEMKRAFGSLKTRDQQLLYLRHHKDMKVKEIATVMGVSEGRISQLYKEIIVKLRGLFKIDL